MTKGLRHPAPAPLTALVDAKLSPLPTGRRLRRIASLVAARGTLELRTTADDLSSGAVCHSAQQSAAPMAAASTPHILHEEESQGVAASYDIGHTHHQQAGPRSMPAVSSSARYVAKPLRRHSALAELGATATSKDLSPDEPVCLCILDATVSLSGSSTRPAISLVLPHGHYDGYAPSSSLRNRLGLRRSDRPPLVPSRAEESANRRPARQRASNVSAAEGHSGNVPDAPPRSSRMLRPEAVAPSITQENRPADGTSAFTTPPGPASIASHTADTSQREMQNQNDGPNDSGAGVTNGKAAADLGLETRSARASGGLRVKLYFFSEKKRTMWYTALRAASRWKFSSFYWLDHNALPLGQGMYACVRPAVDRSTRLPVAVKVIPKSQVNPARRPRGDDTFARRRSAKQQYFVHPKLDLFIQRELRISQTVQHESIVKVLDVFETPSAVAIVMEAYPYTLEDIVKNRSAYVGLDEHVAAYIVASLLSALVYLHERDIVHRDIKPQNVLLSALQFPMRAVLCDFGLAGFIDRRSAWIASAKAARAFEASPHAVPVGLTPFSDSVSTGDMPAPSHHLVSTTAKELSVELPGSQSGSSRQRGHGFGSTAATEPRSMGTAGGADSHGRLGTSVNTIRRALETSNFGMLDGLTCTSAVGEPEYVAPEVVERERYGSPVDVWGVGVLLYYMLAGRTPFADADAATTFERVRDSLVEFGPEFDDVSSEAIAFVKALMNKDQRKRISAEAALLHPWVLKPPVNQRTGRSSRSQESDDSLLADE